MARALSARGRRWGVHELGRAKEPGTGNRVMGRDTKGRRAERRGEGGIYGRRESSEARARAPSPIGGLLNPGGAKHRD